MLSPFEGHSLVRSALSDLPKDNGQLRFYQLIRSLAVSHTLIGEELNGMEGIWEWRVSALGLFNALANTPDNLEERCEIRGELDRRGLSSALEVSSPDNSG